MNNDYALWILFSIFVGIALSIDLGLFGKLKNIIIRQKEKNPIHNQTQDILDPNHESFQKFQQQQTQDALKWTIVWISLAGIFAVIVFFNMGYEKMLEFVSAYTVEKSLSVDNMFIFLLCYRKEDVNRLLTDSGIIRNRLKIATTIQNAKAFLKIQKELCTFDIYIWQFVGGKTINHKMKTIKDISTKTKEYDAMSKDLIKRGFKFVGSTICYAFMQAVGMVNDHEIQCFRYKEY